MPTIQRLLTDETGQALVTAINNIVAAVKPNATEIQMGANDTTTVAEAINTQNQALANKPDNATEMPMSESDATTVASAISMLTSNIGNLSTTVSGLPTKAQVAQNLQVNGSFTTDNENNYTTPGITSVYVSRTLASVAVNQWMVLVVAGSTGSHLHQILLTTGKLFSRYYESGSWSAWSGGAI